MPLQSFGYARGYSDKEKPFRRDESIRPVTVSTTTHSHTHMMDLVMSNQQYSMWAYRTQEAVVCKQQVLVPCQFSTFWETI